MAIQMGFSPGAARGYTIAGTALTKVAPASPPAVVLGILSRFAGV